MADVEWWVWPVALLWVVLWRARRKRYAGHLDASIGAGAVRDLTGRGGF